MGLLDLFKAGGAFQQWADDLFAAKEKAVQVKDDILGIGEKLPTGIGLSLKEATRTTAFGGTAHGYEAADGRFFPTQHVSEGGVVRYQGDFYGRHFDANGNEIGGGAGGASAPAVQWPLPSSFAGIVGAGQSQIEGRGDAAQSPSVAEGVGYEIAYPTVHLEDPVGEAASGSVFPAFANSLYETKGIGTLVRERATGGSAMHPGADSGKGFWDPRANGNRYGNLTGGIQQMRDQADAGGFSLLFVAALWSQGERDAQAIDAGDITAQQYEDAFEALITELAADEPGVRLYVIQTGAPASGDTAGWQAVREAQARLCRRHANAVMAFDRARGFPARGLMTDELHWSQGGLTEAGGVAARVLAREEAYPIAS